jgi:hypothetical protein
MSYLLLKYNVPKIAKFKRRSKAKPDFSPTVKWIEYSLDLLEAKKLLANTSEFTSKFEVEAVINKIKAKINYHENHADFDLQTAIKDFRNARKLLQM